ncbi:MAG: hypothetical protein GX552_00260 [Chloroflexi bacterium]|nr:hypothetical protein [Chloroflexota bacterium]
MIILLSTSLLGCSAVMERLTEVLYPATPSEAATAATALPADTLAPTITPEPITTTQSAALTPTAPASQPPDATLQPGAGQSLVYVLTGSLYSGDAFGADPVELAALPQLDAWAFDSGRLAMTGGAVVDWVDLTTGQTHTARIEAQPDFAQVVWGVAGRALLHIALVSDGVELRALSADDGSELGRARIPNAHGLRVLRYDEQQNRVAVLLQPEAFDQMVWYDLAAGEQAGTFPAEGAGEAALSPDGRYLLAEQFPDTGALLILYDLIGQKSLRAWGHPAGAHSVYHRWSPDGRYVAYLLREGSTFAAETTRGLGVWVLDVETMQAQRILEDDSLASLLVGWTPDSAYLLGYHRQQGADGYYYVVRPDGGDRRILSVPPDAELLGWMPFDDSPTRVEIDPWRARFLSVAVAPDATAAGAVVADLIGEWLAAGAGGQEPAPRLEAYLQAAGWPTHAGQPLVRDMGDGTLVVSLASMVYVVESHGAQAVARGDVTLDARRAGDDLGLITAVDSEGILQPTYTLLRRQPDGAWTMIWMPQGYRDWIATDGTIRFVGEGLDVLEVTGSSFGLDVGEQAVFDECRACIHRRLVGTWERSGDAYVRRSQLPPTAETADALWEITERTPYAILNEALRRGRLRLSVDELADPALVEQLAGYGLLDPQARLVCDEELPDGVRFRDAAGARHYLAQVQDGRLIAVSQVVP